MAGVVGEQKQEEDGSICQGGEGGNRGQSFTDGWEDNLSWLSNASAPSSTPSSFRECAHVRPLHTLFTPPLLLCL